MTHEKILNSVSGGNFSLYVYNAIYFLIYPPHMGMVLVLGIICKSKLEVKRNLTTWSNSLMIKYTLPHYL